MAIDVSDGEPQRSFGEIPDGTFVKAILAIRPGGESIEGMDAGDAGLFKASKSSDAMMLDCEFTIVAPAEYEHRKWWENFVVAGGNVDEKGVSKGWNMTKSRIRAMVESATNTDPNDESAAAKAKRVLPNFKALDGCPFYCKLRLEEGGANPNGGFYNDKNVIDRIIVPGDPEYAPLVRGEKVEPKPNGRSAKKEAPAQGQMFGHAAPKAAGPAWGGKPTAAQVKQGVEAQAPAASAAAPAKPAGPAWLNG